MAGHSGLGYYLRRVLRVSLETGTMAHLLHRVTGLLIVVYLFLHIGAMSYTYFDAGSGFDDLMATFASTPFLIVDLVLFAGVMIHGLNGLRIMLFDMGYFSRRQKELFWVMMAIAATSVLIATWLVGAAHGWW
ncbi:MAG: succinate dehydrogenase, cytochrome b556 subunit [Thermoplasmata archaeon]|nr:succinate dehydrogenase, cytochrome b556 subunit [Thermoplasmata archaeon]